MKFTAEATLYVADNFPPIVLRLEKNLQIYDFFDIDDFSQKGAIRLAMIDEVEDADTTRERLISQFSDLVTEFDIHVSGVFFYDDSRVPFFLGKDASMIQRLQSDYISSEIAKIMSGMDDIGFKENDMLVSQLDYAITRILEGKPLEAVLYQSSGLQTDLVSPVPVRLLIVEDDLDSGIGDATVMESPDSPGTQVALSAFYSQGNDEDRAQAQKYHESFLAADPDSPWDRRELGADPRFVSTQDQD